jgi:hypothetical protein
VVGKDDLQPFVVGILTALPVITAGRGAFLVVKRLPYVSVCAFVSIEVLLMMTGNSDDGDDDGVDGLENEGWYVERTSAEERIAKNRIGTCSYLMVEFLFRVYGSRLRSKGCDNSPLN